MRTYEQKTETREVSVVKSVTCDRCEKEIETTKKNTLDYGYEAVYLEIRAGYGSRHDFAASENQWRFDICDDCCEEWLKTFKKDYLTVRWDEDE